MVLCTLFSLQSHMLLLVCVCQSILEDTVYKGLVAKFGTSTHGWEIVGSVGHGFGSSSNDNVGGPSHDCLSSTDHGLDARGTHFVDGSAYSRFGEAGANGTLSGRVLAETIGCQYR